VQYACAAVFAGFLALGVCVRVASEPEARRRWTLRLIAYVAGVSLLAGLTQKDAWPFTSHTIAVGRARPDAPVCLIELAGVDGDGQEWRLDPYSWMPLYESVLHYWLERNLSGLTPPERDVVLSFLLARADASRERLSTGRAIGPQRWLGPLGAPYWLLLPRPSVSAQPLTGLRVYQACWVPRERYADPLKRRRRLLAEHFAPVAFPHGGGRE
jgi:hypothetical protein